MPCSIRSIVRRRPHGARLLFALLLSSTGPILPAKADDAALSSAFSDAPADLPTVTPALPDALPPGRALQLGATAASSAVGLTVDTAMLRPAFGKLKAAAGRQLLVLSGQWKNLIAMRAVREAKKPTEYKIPNLADHLYIVVNGTEVGRLVAKDNSITGHVPIKEFGLPRVGDTISGNMIFTISADRPVRSLEVRFYDPESSGFVLPLVQPGQPTAEVATAKDKPIGYPAANQVLEAGVYGIARLPEVDGKAPPPGTEFVSIDLRARSTATIPARKSGEKPKPTVADWNDALKHVTLLVDNEYAASPVATPLTTLDLAPRVLPDVPTGGRVVFRVPAKAKSLELQCTFSQAAVAGQLIKPRPIEIRVEGSPPAKVQLKPVVPPMVDDVFFTAVTKVETPVTFAGEPAGDGKQWLLVSITVANTGKAGEYFQPREQLKFLTAKGESQPMDTLAADGPRAPAEPTWVPAEERRSFQAVYRMAADEPALRLAYSGIAKGGVITLPGGTGKGAIESAKAPGTTPAIAKAGDIGGVAARPPTPRKVLPADKPLVREKKNFPSRVLARQPLSPKGIEGVGLKPEQVNAAIDRGATALWKRVQDRLAKHASHRLGDEPSDLIASLALVHAGWHKKDPAFDAALRGMLAKYDPKQKYQTYQNGLSCMIIEGLGDTTFVPQLAASAQWIVDQQGPTGTWNYGKYVGQEEADASSTPRKVLSVVGGRPPEDSARGTQPLVRRTASIDYTDGDNSVSQYAILGLHSATRSGFEIARDAFAAFLDETRDRQNEDGGWSYHGTSSSSYGSMTCAGICAVALARFEMGEKEPWKDESIERGLAWLNAYFRVDDHPESRGNWIFYYLYSLERVGRILDTEFIGDHEWYPAGARWLIDTQKPTGLWFSESGSEAENYAEIPTSFALLFLTRATASLGERVIPQGPGTLKTAALLPPGNRLYVILDCSGSMLEAMDGREKFEIAKDAVRAMIKDMPDNSEVALRAYGYRLRAIQPGASEDTKLLVPLKTLDRKEMSGFIDGLRCRGKTPMALSLEQAAADLKSATTPEKPITAVLLTDGGEDSQPRKDPVKAAAAFGEIENVSLRIVGFDINRDDWKQQLAAMATAGRARYLPADKGDELQRELRAAVFGIPETCTVLDAAGKPIKTLAFGEPLTLEPGKYQFTTVFGGQPFTESFYISPGETTAITFDSSAIAAEANAAKAAAAKTSTEAATPRPTTETPAERPAAKFCKNCGVPLKPGVKFCTHCGAKVGE